MEFLLYCAGKETLNVQIRCSDDDDVKFYDTTQNVNPAISPSQRTGMTHDIVDIEVVENEEVGDVQGVTEEGNGGQHVGMSFISFALDGNKDSFVSAMMVVAVFGVRKFALSHEIQQDGDEWRDSVCTMCALVLFIAAITIL